MAISFEADDGSLWFPFSFSRSGVFVEGEMIPGKNGGQDILEKNIVRERRINKELIKK